MHILIGYPYASHSTGAYFQRSLKKLHKVTYVGPAWSKFSGYLLNVDLGMLASEMVPKPDFFLFVDSHSQYFPRGLEKLSCPTIAYLIDVHLGLPIRLKQARFFDYVFVAQKDYVEKFRKTCPSAHVEWLPLAFDPEIHCKQNLEKVYDIGFVGQVGKRHKRRAERLSKLAKHYRLNDYRRFYDRYEMARVYNQSRIVFNGSSRGDLSMRVFEALGCGTMLLTERIANGQEELFKDREHLVIYDDDEELLELAEYYLVHESERERIAQSGHKLALEKHTYDRRVDQTVQTWTDNPGAKAVWRNANADAISRAYLDLYSSLRMVDAVMDEMVRRKKDSSLGRGRYYHLILALLRRIKHDIYSK